ncbi:UDP-glucose 4-epimerase family protein [Neptunomonas antarctica]|uniref:Nucleoside-diphosphate-sugar epimerase n=1 Tax=Neptunomonas antarctica TaxID=619304 RepID=A0A1N7JDL6_9GAMM|nr:SDR family oxidoreductase [Neptunomonas antarctica]SIS47341.1 Nucleoside-diphosphate-sugar epimerase [Neptunomonas antarctica]
MLDGVCVLITGANGFLGKHLIHVFSEKGIDVIGAYRAVSTSSDQNSVAIGNIDSMTDWSNVLKKRQVVIHTAARAHIMKDSAVDPLTAYREVNTAGTLHLARQAAMAGVKRFIFISSIKVNGETTTSLPAFAVNDTPAPQDPYGVSKMEAEDGLRKIAQDAGMEVVIIRPPLIYGPGVKANFRNLMKLANTAVPLPFGAIHNIRSMLYIGNLVGFIVKCIDHPAAANQTFLLSDGQDLSLTELLCLLRSSMKKPTRLVPVSASFFRVAGSVTGKRAVVDRLVGSLQVDSSKACELLNWQPPYTVEQGIKATTDHFLKE